MSTGQPSTNRRQEPIGPLEILLEDDHLLAAVKPTGLPTANAPRGTASLFTAVQAHLPPGAFVGVVSRLDAPVSGVVVMAKTKAAAADLALQFRQRTIEKAYVAICEGRFPAPLGEWVDWHDLLSRPAPAGGEVEMGPEQAAHVRCRVTRRAGEVSLVELEPSSGRRHQLRVQLASRGCPIVGDRMYGSRLPFPNGIALHSRILVFDHPASGTRIRLEAPLPDPWKSRYPQLMPPRRG
jgi:23S rRNA pseudouridine1911/1915/1917 synthase